MRRAMLIGAGAATAALVAASSVQAQSTAAAPSNDPTTAQIDSWIAGRHGDVDGGDAQATTSPRIRDGRVHGEVGASIGSGGYKSAYGVATKPIGDNSDLTVGVSSEHLGDGNRGYGGRGYGYGGDRRSLFIGLNLNGADQRITGCDPLQRRPWNGAQAPLAAASERCEATDPTPTSPPPPR